MDHSPCLMYNEKSKNLWRFSQPNTFFHKRFPKFDNAVIRFSNHGWLLMMPRQDNTIFFLDPFDDRTIQLPSPPEKYTTICFFHPPTSPECFIVGIECFIHYPKYFVNIGLLRQGESEWMNHTYDHKEKELDLSLSPPVLKNGLVYFMDAKGNVATFDISRHGGPIDKAWTVHDSFTRQPTPCNNFQEHFLIKPEGEDAIFAVFGIDEERYVRVFRLLEPANSWEPVYDLGEKVFFVSNTSSSGYTARDKSLVNKIFFPKLRGDKFVYYSLDTEKYHSIDATYSSRDSYGLKRLDFATWTMPTQQFDSGDELSWCAQTVDEDAAT